MVERFSNVSSAPSSNPRKEGKNSFSRLAIIFAIALTLSGCSNPQKEYKKCSKEVTELTALYEQQAQNYEEVATQENIQQDLKNEWADPTINQDIWYSHDRANDQDKNIAETKKQLSKAQRNLAKAKEDLAKAEAVKKKEEAEREASKKESNKQKLNPHKYDYVKEELKRGREVK